MANIKARVGNQNVVKVLSNSPAGIQRLINLKDVDENTLLDGALLVWDTSNSNFIMTNVVDTTLTIAGSVDAFGSVTNTESTSFNNGALVVQGGVGISGNLNVAGIATFGTGTIVVDGDNDLVTVGTGVTISSSEGIDTPSLRIDGPLSAEQLNISGISTLARLGGLTTTGGDLFVGRNLHVAGVSTFIGNATFRGGTIGIGDSSSDDINVQGEFVSNLIPNTTDTYDIGSNTQKWRNAYFEGTGSFADLLTVGNLSTPGISTAETFSGFTNLKGIHSSTTKTFVVTVVAKTANHRYFGSGSSNGYVIDGIESPVITLNPGTTYRFDQSHISNNGHPLFFYLTSAKGHQYLTNLNQVGSPGSPGGYIEITIDDETPAVLHYQCSAHQLMGNQIQVISNKVVTPYSAIFHDSIDVSGVSTFASDLDVNASVDISTDLTVGGLTDLDEFYVRGVSTFNSDLDINSSVDISNNIIVDGLTDLDELNVAGIATFLDRAIFNSTNSIQIPVGTTAQRDAVGVAVTGQIRYNTELSSFEGYGPGGEWGSLGGVKDVDQDTYIIPETAAGSDEDTLYFYTGGTLTGTISSTLTTLNNDITLGKSNSVTITGPEEIIIDPLPVGVGTTSGTVFIKGDLFVQGRQFQVDSTTVNIADKVVGIATTCTSNILLDGAGIGIGTEGNKKTLLYDNTNTALKSSENFNLQVEKVYQIDGNSVLSATTLGAGVTNSSLTNVDTLIDLNVSGLTDLDGGLDVLGHSELDNLNVSGLSTYVGIATYQSDVFVDGTLTAGVIDGGTY